MPLLQPEERKEWPQAWRAFFGWRMTWREAPWWLGRLGIAVPHHSAALLAHPQTGRVYLQLIHRINTEPHRCAVGRACAHESRAAPS